MLIINGKFLSQMITGVQRVSLEITKRLDEDLDFVNSSSLSIISPNNAHVDHLYRNIKVIKKGKISPSWEYITLALEVLKKGASVFSFSSGFPPFAKDGLYFMHDVAFLRIPRSFSRKFKCLYWAVFKYIIERNKKILVITNSYFSKNEILTYFPNLADRIFIVPLGYEHITFLQPNLDLITKLRLKKRSYFVTVASLNYHKNLYIVIKAAQQRPDVKFVVIGQKPSKSVFRNVDIKDIPANVCFTGYIDDENMCGLVSNSRGLIFPSLYEGFGLPALEALALNVPLLLSDITVFREIYNDVALFFNPYDAMDLSKKIDLLSKPKPDARNKILSLYTWDNCVKQIKDIWLKKVS